MQAPNSTQYHVLSTLQMPLRAGLNQLYAMRYGTVPIAHGTGGLKDTVIDVVTSPEGEGTGWTYSTCDAGVGAGAEGAVGRSPPAACC